MFSCASAGVLCRVNKQFVLESIAQGLRVDRRDLYDCRDAHIKYNESNYGQVEVSLGHSCVLCVVSAELTSPSTDRPQEGALSFFVDFTGTSRSVQESNEVIALLDRLLKGTRAVDMEALCVLAGHKVWSVRVCVRALNDDGNLRDACCLAAVCAILHFRVQDVTVTGTEVKVHSAEQREPLPLCVHHMPLNISVGFFDILDEAGDPLFVVDPNLVEEELMTGTMCMAINQFGEVCGVHKPGGAPLSRDTLHKITRMVSHTAIDVIGKLKITLQEDKQRRELRRRNVHEIYTQQSVPVPTET
eukprot:GHVS01010088.1.p1 GENE.GHVS01010088.1~~GHVS01010088.1.p1  ORF type:complete len:302 (+),score=51.75 GHVS01010088.1:202-1107(+)